MPMKELVSAQPRQICWVGICWQLGNPRRAAAEIADIFIVAISFLKKWTFYIFNIYIYTPTMQLELENGVQRTIFFHI